MTHKALYIAAIIVFLAGTVYLAAVNTQSIAVSAFNQTFQVPLAWIVIKLFLLGAASAYCAGRLKRREQKSEQKQLEWKAQDAKLAAEIQTDTVKLLEAKIATLETALDKALKKRN